MARVVGVYALVLVGVLSVFIAGGKVLGNALRRDALTFRSVYAYNTSDIFSLDLLTGEVTQLTLNGDIIEYALSPDGMWLAGTVDRAGLDSYIAIFDWFGRIEIGIGGRFGIMFPEWLPDSETIAFWDLSEMRLIEIYTTLIHDPQNWQLLAELDTSTFDTPAISPDGNSMVFVSDGSDGLGLALLDLRTGEWQDFWDDGREPDWSPDGQWIAYTSGQSDIYSINVQDKTTHQLTSGSFHDGEPAWSPDGSQIAFVSDRDGDNEIFIMNADGSNVRQVTFNDVDDTKPAWVP